VRSLDMALLVALAVALIGVTLHFVRQRAALHALLARTRAEFEATHRVLFEQCGDGLIVCSGDGRVLSCNPAAQRLLAADAAALVGSTIEQHFEGLALSGGGAGAALGAGQQLAKRRGAPALAVEVELHPLRHGGKPRLIVSLRDLTERRQAQDQLKFLANFDSLTGLPNRALFRDRLAQAMLRAQRSNQAMALMFLDLDRFKVVNDSLGHEAGDRLLCHVAQTLKASLRGVDTLGRSGGEEAFTLSRLGGDEFTVIAENVGNAEQAGAIARRLLDALAVPFKVGEEEIHISASIGVSLFPMDDVDLDGMIRHTDMAMYRAKSLGRNTFSFFSDDLNQAVSTRLSLEGSLRRAIERNEFCLHYQPKADLKSGRISGVEALIRWHCPGRGMVPPDRFIAVLEDTGLILQVGAWVVRTALTQLAEWDRAGLPAMGMAVNLSARQLRQPYLLALVEDTLRESGVDPARLEFELTESLLMEDTEANRAVLAGFARLGVRLAIDDFGTGHSSLSYLRRLDVDTLKIDRSFVNELPHDAEDCAIATAVVALGRSLQMKVVAEGVETAAQADYLRQLGCDEMQGYLLSRPLPAAELAPWLRQHHDAYLARVRPQHFAAKELKPLSLAATTETVSA
jgi:predicted signal transduction protein with EAL and GGDEF domain